MTTTPTTARQHDAAQLARANEGMRGRIKTLEGVARTNASAHRVAYAALLNRESVLQRIRDAASLEEVAEALETLEDGWPDEMPPVDEDVRDALAEHLWQMCQRHSQAPALFEDPRTVAHHAIDMLRAMWRLPNPPDAEPPLPDPSEDGAALDRIRWWRRKQPADEPVFAGLDEILTARTVGQVQQLAGCPEPTTYAEAVEAHRVLCDERRRSMDDLAQAWDIAEADAIARIERLTPDEPETSEDGGEQEVTDA